MSDAPRDLLPLVLKLIDQLRAARAASTSPADILTAITTSLDALEAEREQIEAAQPPVEESPAEPVPEPVTAPTEPYAPYVPPATEAQATAVTHPA